MTNKNQQTEHIQNHEPVCFVMNLVDHTSLAAATLLHTVMKDKGLDAKLADVRDVLPEAETYVWINAGLDQNLKSFFPVQSQYSDIHGRSTPMRDIFQKSIYIYASAFAGGDNPSYLFQALLDRVKAIASLSEDEYEQLDALFWIVNAHSAAWSAAAGGALEDAATYHGYLQACYRNYKHSFLTTDKIKEILATKDTEEFLKLNQTMNETFSKRAQKTSVLGETTIYFTFIDEEIYSVIRRIESSKHKFYHLSEGVYGPVAYTNIEHVVKMGDRNTLVLHSA